MEVSYSGERPSLQDVAVQAEELLGEKSAVQEVGENGFILRTRELTPAEHTALIRSEIAKWKKVAQAAGLKPQ